MVASTPKVARLARGKAPIGLKPCREEPPLGSSLSKCRHLLSLVPTKGPVPARKHRGLTPKVLPGYCKFSISCFSGKARTIPDRLTEQKTYSQESYEIETAPSSAKICAYSVKRGTSRDGRFRAVELFPEHDGKPTCHGLGAHVVCTPSGSGGGLTLVRRGAVEASLRREELGDGRELVARSAKAVDHRGERLHEPLRRARGSLGIVQVHDGAGVSAAEDATHLVLGRHGPEAFRLDGPEHAPLTQAAERAEHRRVYHAPRRTEVTGRAVHERGERFVGAADRLGGTPRPAEPQGPMRPPVARDFVAFADDAAHGVGRPSRALAHQEERRARSALREEVEDAWCPVGIGTVVERERHAPARVAAAPDAAEREQVGAPRICRPPGSRGETKPRQDPGRRTGRSRSSSTAATMRCVASGRRTRRIRARSRSRRSGSPRARSSRWTSSR